MTFEESTESRGRGVSKSVRVMFSIITLMTLVVSIPLLYDNELIMMATRPCIQSLDSKLNVTYVEPRELDPPDTSVIILTSLIPTHPSIEMVNETFNSVYEMLDGLPENTPVFIASDGLHGDKKHPEKDRLNDESINRYDDYLKNLRLRFYKNPHVTLVNNYRFGHISNTLRVVLELVETEFIYVLQHDLKFSKHVNHTGLVNVMKENPQEVQIVRFGKSPFMKEKIVRRRNRSHCREVWSRTYDQHGIHLELGRWSDNNHFTTKAYYEKVLDKIGSFPRTVEGPMMNSGSKIQNVSECAFLNQYLYNAKDSPFLFHLDGRLTLPNATDSDQN